MPRGKISIWVARIARRLAAWLERREQRGEPAPPSDVAMAALRARFPGAPEVWLSWILQRRPQHAAASSLVSQRPREPVAWPAADRADVADDDAFRTAAVQRQRASDDRPTSPSSPQHEGPAYHRYRPTTRHTSGAACDTDEPATPALAWERGQHRSGDPARSPATPVSAPPTSPPPSPGNSSPRYDSLPNRSTCAAAPPQHAHDAEKRREAEDRIALHARPHREWPISFGQAHWSPAAAATFAFGAPPPPASSRLPDCDDPREPALEPHWPPSLPRQATAGRLFDGPIPHAKSTCRLAYPGGGQANAAPPAFPEGQDPVPPSFAYPLAEHAFRDDGRATEAAASPWPRLPDAWHEPRPRFAPAHDLQALQRRQEEIGWSA